MTLRMVDASHYQGAVDWAGLTRAHGLSAGMCKATEGMTFTDSRLAYNRAAIAKAGLVRGFYHYAHGNASSGAAQARRFAAIAKPAPGDFMCLDLEVSDGLSQSELNAWAIDFLDTLDGLAGSTMVYLGDGYATNGTGRNLADHTPHWMFPRYATTAPAKGWPAVFAPRVSPGITTGWRAPHIWQWTPNLGGFDASISTLSAAELAAPVSTDANLEAIMAWYASRADFEDAVAHAVQAYDQQGDREQAWSYLQRAAATLANLIDPAKPYLTAIAGAVAREVIAELPPGNGGAVPTVDEVADAVAARLGTLLSAQTTP